MRGHDDADVGDTDVGDADVGDADAKGGAPMLTPVAADSADTTLPTPLTRTLTAAVGDSQGMPVTAPHVRMVLGRDRVRGRESIG